ncbi:MAG TPA: acyl-CoA dehydrogenase [Acidimicrobiales bacterium]|nr:acyl-CoA dehydrogenase [Acidimicrobiales bacterium]
MDVRLSPEQVALRASAARVVGSLGPHVVSDLDDAERAGQLRRAVEDSGWSELRQPAEGSEPVATAVEVAVVAEELGRGLADVGFLGPTMAAELRRRVGAPGAPERETVVLEPGLVGLASAVPNEAPTGVAIDAAGASAGLVLVSGDGPGPRRLGRVALERGRTQTDLTRVTALPGSPSTAVDGVGALDDEDLVAWLALGLAVTCADLVGVMAGAVELARRYAVDRRQFEAPIGSFQAVAHMLADAYVVTEGSRSVALYAAWAVDALPPSEALAAAALAKAYCARAARNVCEISVQVHGGIGNTWECLAHVYLRRALLSSELFGGAEASVERVLAHRGIPVAAGSGHGLR